MTAGPTESDARAEPVPASWRVGRILASIGIWYALLRVSLFVVTLGPYAVGAHSDTGTLTIEKTFGTDGPLGVVAGLTSAVVVALAWGLVARRVDYRWFDGFQFLVPVWGLFWSARIVWRSTYVVSPAPARDWRPASERRESWADRVVRRVSPWST